MNQIKADSKKIMIPLIFHQIRFSISKTIIKNLTIHLLHQPSFHLLTQNAAMLRLTVHLY